MQLQDIDLEKIWWGLIQYNKVIFTKGDIIFFYNDGKYQGERYWKEFSSNEAIIQFAKNLFEESR